MVVGPTRSLAGLTQSQASGDAKSTLRRDIGAVIESTGDVLVLSSHLGQGQKRSLVAAGG